MLFRGTFDYTLDAKNRLTVPAKFRPQLADGLVLSKGLEQNVAIWTPEDFDAHVAAALEGFHPLSPEAQKLNRFFSANAIDVELDAAGRVGIPAFLLEHAELKKDVVLTGATNCLEVWDRGVWEAYNRQLGPDVSDITALLGRAATPRSAS